MHNRKALVQLLVALLIGLTGAMGTLLLLSQGASAGPMLDEVNLTISKSANADHVPAGAPLTYTLAYTNTGDANATNVVITDVLDSNVIYASASPPPTGWTTPTLYWDIGVLSPSTSGEIVISVTVQSGLGEGTTITNLATIDSQETTPLSVTETTVISYGPLDHFAFANVSDQTAGTPFAITITARDAYDNLKTDYSGPADLSDSTGTLDPTSTGIFTAGEWTGGVTIVRTGSAVVITATDGLVSGASNSFTVDPASLANFAFDSISGQTAGTPFAITITARDTYDNLKTDYTASADLSDSTGTIVPFSTGSFTAGEWAGSVTITRIGSSVIITAEDDPISSDSNSFTVDPADLEYIILSPPVSTIFGWQVQTYTTEAFDVYDNSRGNVTAQTSFSILEGGHGGSWAENVYTPQNPGDWTVRAIHTGTCVTTDTASLTVLTPVMHLDKSDDPGDTVEAGDYLTYTLTYSNTGNMKATGVVVTDTLDPNVSYVTASPAPSGGLPDAPFWSVADVAPDQLGQISVTVAVASPLSNGTTLTNTAWIEADQPVSASATETTTVHSSPVLTITKTDWPDPIGVGDFLKYTVVITNSGNENATTVTVTENYDPNVSFLFANPDPDAGSGNRVWTFSTLVVDVPETIEIFVQVSDTIPGGTVLTNAVTLDSDQTTPISTTETTEVLPKSDLVVTQSYIPDIVDAGTPLVYSIHYKNNGTSDATNVVITDTYDSRVDFSSASPPPDAGNNVWYIGTLEPGDSDTIMVWVDVDTPLPNGTLLINTVTIDSDQTAPTSFITTTEVNSAPDLTFSVTDQPDPVEAGDPLTYTLRYTNTGNADATQVVVTATLDSFAPFSNSTPAPTGGEGDVRYWELGTIPGVDGYREIVIHTDVTLPLTNGTTLNFAMQLEDAEGDSLEDTITTTVESAPVLSLHKSDGVSIVYAGDLLTYTLVYTNSGNENGYDVTITDTLPVSYTQYVGCEIAAGTCQHVPAEGVVIFQIPVITAPTSAQAQVVVQVDDSLPAGADVVTNTARMTAPCLAEPIDAQDVDHIGTLPNLIVTAVHTPSLFSPGQLMTYTVTYSNAGWMDAKDVTITTILPVSTTYEGYDWSSSDGQTYTYQAGDLPVGYSDSVVFTVKHEDAEHIGAPEFNTPFTIAETMHGGGDANPDDNTAYVYIGVPDLVVLDFTVVPLSLEPNMPVTFTITLLNQGTGMAWNPDSHGGFWVDIFTAPVPSYPFERFGEIFGGSPPIAPGITHTVTIIHSGFTEQEIRDIKAFYVKADNHADPVFDGEGRFLGWTRLYGLAPEYNEMNNLGGSITLNDPLPHTIYLPLVTRH